MGGWFRKEIKRPEDLKGVKMRIGGFAGQVMAKLGVVPQQIAGGEIYPALEKGTIDAAEWVGPYDDEKLGFNKVAQYYYYPGWWEGGATLHNFVNIEEMERAAAGLQGDRSLRSGARWMLAKYDALNPGAEATGGERRQVRPFPQPVLEACFNAGQRALCRDRRQEPRVQEGLRRVEAPSATKRYLWLQVGEYTFDNFMVAQSAAAALSGELRFGGRKAPLRGPFSLRISVAWHVDSRRVQSAAHT